MRVRMSFISLCLCVRVYANLDLPSFSALWRWPPNVFRSRVLYTHFKLFIFTLLAVTHFPPLVCVCVCECELLLQPTLYSYMYSYLPHDNPLSPPSRYPMPPPTRSRLQKLVNYLPFAFIPYTYAHKLS